MRSQGDDAVQVAVALREVKAVADDELGLDIPTDILDVNIGLHALRLAQQSADFHGRRGTPGSAATT